MMNFQFVGENNAAGVPAWFNRSSSSQYVENVVVKGRESIQNYDVKHVQVKKLLRTIKILEVHVDKGW